MKEFTLLADPKIQLVKEPPNYTKLENNVYLIVRLGLQKKPRWSTT